VAKHCSLNTDAAPTMDGNSNKGDEENDGLFHECGGCLLSPHPWILPRKKTVNAFVNGQQRSDGDERLHLSEAQNRLLEVRE